MNYYRDLVTTKSWQLLQHLAKNYNFVLIGGWAVWLYTRQLKSKDIDLVIEFDELAKLKAAYPLTKNDRLKKYEIIQSEIHIDIYVPHYSRLGLPAENILKSAVSLAGFRVPPPETLLILKQTASTNRVGSSKGRKDLIDIISLLLLPQLDWSRIPQSILVPLKSQTSIPELDLNSHQFSRLKQKWANMLNLN